MNKFLLLKILYQKKRGLFGNLFNVLLLKNFFLLQIDFLFSSSILFIFCCCFFCNTIILFLFCYLQPQKKDKQKTREKRRKKHWWFFLDLSNWGNAMFFDDKIFEFVVLEPLKFESLKEVRNSFLLQIFYC